MASPAAKQQKNKFQKTGSDQSKKNSSQKTVNSPDGGLFEDHFDSSLLDLFVSELRDIFWAENHLVGALPKMIDASEGPLKKALQDHWKETKNHVSRLELVFEIAGKPALAKKCDAMEGLTMSGEHTVENTLAGSPARKGGVIGSGLKVENFEITCYKSLIQMANILKLNKAVPLLEKTLQEETAAAEKLEKLNTDGNSK